LERGGSLDESFGPPRMRVFTKSAKEPVTSSAMGMALGMLRIASMIARARIHGDYLRNPFFTEPSGQPIVIPKVLTPHEYETLMSRL
jgi:hypothetical protein